MALVRIPTPLRRLTNEKDEVNSVAKTVSELLDDLDNQFPGIKNKVCESDGSIRKFINIYINDEDIRFLDGPKSEIKEEDTVSIIPAIAGGYNYSKNSLTLLIYSENGFLESFSTSIWYSSSNFFCLLLTVLGITILSFTKRSP